MNDTEQLFIAAAVWALIAAVIARFIPNWPGRIAFFAIAVGLPFWELPYGYYNFRALCGDEGGLRVFEKIPPQETVCADFPFENSARDLLKFGFSQVEARGKGGDIRTFPGNLGSGPSNQPMGRVSSAYCITFKNNNHLPWGMIRHDFLIAHADNGHIAARHSVFDWFGMWWQQMARPVLGRGGECREDPIPAIVSTLRKGAG
jgi:hypothetical protein